MDKHNNEIYKNWYSTNINGKKNLSPTITIPYPPPGNAWCLSRILVAMHQLFFYQPSHVLKLSFMCSTESFQNTCILVTIVVNYI